METPKLKTTLKGPAACQNGCDKTFMLAMK
jgi:hypothetical protein